MRAFVNRTYFDDELKFVSVESESTRFASKSIVFDAEIKKNKQIFQCKLTDASFSFEFDAN